MTHVLELYIPVLAFIIVGISFGLAPLLFSSLIGPRKKTAAKADPYECGFNAFGLARTKFDVRYYLVAILFIIFDLEVAFLFPWAVIFKQLSWPAFYAMGIFLALLTVGFIYEWKKGALEWE